MAAASVGSRPRLPSPHASDGHVRLADFGLCKVNLPPDGRTQTFCGTPNYLAPEVVSYKAYGKEVRWAG